MSVPLTAGKAHRGTICLEDARLLARQAFAGDQYILRLEAPKCAARATPGSFVHLSCDPDIPMRRPLSILRADPHKGWIDLLFKVVGDGLAALAARKVGDTLSMLGPIGHGFEPHPARPLTLLIGGGVGIPPMVFLAEQLAGRDDAQWQPLVLMGSEIPFPFDARPSTIMVPGIPHGVIAAMPALDAMGVASRLASKAGFPGCYDGWVTQLADDWLHTLARERRAEIEIFACGPTLMLEATARLARKYELPCQVSLEEFMACAVGGCAGCAVRVETDDGPAMKRVCVDGPVFDAYSVFAG